MAFLDTGAGLTPVFPSPPEAPGITEVITEEAAVRPPVGPLLHVTPLVQEGDLVPRGGAVACLRHAPDVRFAAPIAGRVARIDLLPGRRLSEIVLFREDDGGVEHHDTKAATTAPDLRRVLQRAGAWPLLRRRPFGGMPAQDETPAAIFVMGTDTRPFAPDPDQALKGREEALSRGLAALATLTEGPVFLCLAEGSRLAQVAARKDIHMGIHLAPRGARHPQSSAGICMHGLFPAGLDTPVWDIHAEDVAAFGGLLDTGTLSMTRLVRIAGAGLREARLVRSHPGADLRQLTQKIARPGAHVLMSGSPLDGHRAHWLAPRHRQVTVLPRPPVPRRSHWLTRALTRPGVAGPAIPTAALTQALGAALPAPPFLRALGAGDAETAMQLGLLSLLEEDLALADYVLGEGGRLMGQMRNLLDRLREENAA